MTTSGLIPVGFWHSVAEPHLPHARDFIDESWDATERYLVCEYLLAGKVVTSNRGFSLCRICGGHNGSQDLSDGTFIWPSGLAHYVSCHGLRPPAELVAAALGQPSSAPPPEVSPTVLIEQALEGLADALEKRHFGISILNTSFVAHRTTDAVGWRIAFRIAPDKTATAVEYLAWMFNNDMARSAAMRAAGKGIDPPIAVFAPYASPPMFNPGQEIVWMIEANMFPTSTAAGEIRRITASLAILLDE